MNSARPFRWIAALALAGAASLASAQPLPQETPPAESGPPPGVQVTPPPAAPVTSQPAAPPAPAVRAQVEDEGLPASSSAPAKPPPRRVLYTAAVIQVLDKVTAESLRFEAPLHKFIRYKGLIFLVNTCQSGDPDQPGAAAHLEVDSQPPSPPGRPPNPVKLVFRGWMFADTPGPHPLEHPVYDAWLIACKTASPGS
jgi:hypothetical protein